MDPKPANGFADIVPMHACVSRLCDFQLKGGAVMRLERESVVFESMDMNFVKKHGLMAATDMVLDYKADHQTPFLYDLRQLAYFLEIPQDQLRRLLADVGAYYRTACIPKRSGGFRTLSIPLSPLREVQKDILSGVLYLLPGSEHATAYHPGDCLRRNAVPHVSKRCLLKLDITDFFGSITAELVKNVFAAAGYNDEIADVLTALCCLDNALPQGACTSPAMSNLVMKHFDDAFGGWCRVRHFTYTRYCDDITVSGDAEVYPAYRKAKYMLGRMGFEINRKKTRFITNASRQTVTGLTVNEKIAVPSDYRRRLRQELYYVDRFGIRGAAEHLHIDDAERYFQSLMGRLNYVLSVDPLNDYFFEAEERLRRQLT